MNALAKKYGCSGKHPDPDGQRLRLVSYNIQTGTTTSTYRQYLTHSWKHVLPHPERLENLSQIARMLSAYDFVGLQEVDAGSLRSGFINQTEFIAEKAGFPFWSYQTNRRMGKLAQHSNGLLSKFRPSEIIGHKLPGMIPGRGALFARFGGVESSLVIGIVHLALGKRTRLRQLDYISSVVREHDHAIIMGDMNCQPESAELRHLMSRAGLCEPAESYHTFPSWRPAKNIDHILTSPGIHVEQTHVLNHTWSDHLPITTEVIVPSEIRLNAS